MNTYREQMPPLSYLTLLDFALIVNLGLISFCTIVVVASAVHSSLSVCSIDNTNLYPQYLRVKDRTHWADKLERVNM